MAALSAITVPKDYAPEEALSQIERDVFSLCKRSAAAGRPMESIEEVMGMFGFSSYSTVPGIMRRLEQKGLIKRRMFQRGRQICIVSTGECTAEPSCTAPHWRLRPRSENVPTPAIQQVRRNMPNAALLIEQEARRLGKNMSDFLADLVYIGWHEYLAEQEREAV